MTAGGAANSPTTSTPITDNRSDTAEPTESIAFDPPAGWDVGPTNPVVVGKFARDDERGSLELVVLSILADSPWDKTVEIWSSGLGLPALSREELDAALAAVKDVIDADAPWSRRSGMKAYLDKLMAEIDTPEKLSEVMERPFETVDAWARKNGIGPENILFGEFGMIRQEYGNSFVMPAGERAAYYRDMIEKAEARGYAWSLWSYGGAFGVVEQFDFRKAEPDVLNVVRGLPRS